MNQKNIAHKVIAIICCLLAAGHIVAVSSSPAIDVASNSNRQTNTGCSADIHDVRPKIYIADFLVSGAKKDMGKMIGDYIAQRFTGDGRFDLISREVINAEMQPLFKKRTKPEVYLQTTIDLATARNADCVVFGRITKKGKKVSFLVRMASVESGQNVQKVDTDVDAKRASSFLESIGDSFVTYFVSAPAAVPKVISDGANKDFSLHLGFNAITYAPVMPQGYANIWAPGAGFEFGSKGLILKNVLLGLGGEYLYFLNSAGAYAKIYGISAFGFLGYEISSLGKLHFQMLLYGGSQYGLLGGGADVSQNWYGLFMLGPRVLVDLAKSFSLLIEARYVLTVPASIGVSGIALSIGGQQRF